MENRHHIVVLALAAAIFSAVGLIGFLFYADKLRCEGKDAYMIANTIRLGGCVKN